ncbi:MAG: hypothetical protein ACHRXM_37095 [Isosphaerales bacterium]
MDRPDSGEGIIERRRFLLIDTITLVVASALMLSANRAALGLWWWCDVTASNDYETRSMAWSLALTGLSLTLLVSLLAHSADRRRLRRGAPGLFVHLAVATVVFVRITGWLAQASIFEGRPGIVGARWTVAIINYLLDDFRRDIVIAVAATWLTLAMVGRWNPERAWDDRLGRFIGALWMIFYLGAPLLALLP